MVWLLFTNNNIFGQDRTFSSTIQLLTPLQIGSFYPGSNGGSITVSTESGTRSSQGSVVLLYEREISAPATFEFTTEPYTMVHIQIEQSVWLVSPEGGELHLLVGPISTGTTFVAPANASQGIQFSVGGKLIVGPSRKNPPGSYSGSFSVTIICE